MALKKCTPTSGSNLPSHQTLLEVHTPLNVSMWREVLGQHTDQTLVSYIINGLSKGFRIGFHRSHPLMSGPQNLPSAKEQEDVFARYLENKITLGRIIGHFQPSSVWHINCIGIILKRHTPGKWHMIIDLLHPPAANVNDGINWELCTLSYITVEQVAAKLGGLGRGVLLAKVDIETA